MCAQNTSGLHYLRGIDIIQRCGHVLVLHLHAATDEDV